MFNSLRKLKVLLSKFTLNRSALWMWEKRAKKYDARAVLNIAHTDEEFDAVTQMQKEKIFPILKQALTGKEKMVLDFGCGPGRFSPDLARLVKGEVIGVDPVARFLDMAPKHHNVEYRLIKKGVIPVADKSIDIVWICLVLGGLIKKQVLHDNISEICRVLKDEGIVVLVENTSKTVAGQYWLYRSVECYQILFDFVNLEHLADYYDLGERISIMIGKKHV